MFYYKKKNKIIKLNVPESVYEPSEDSILLARVIEKEMENKNIKTALEIGCGSGLLSIIASEFAETTAVDINEKAVETTIKNAQINKTKIRCLHSDLFDKVSGSFDLIIFNPPYLPEEIAENNKIWAAGKNLELIKRFALGVNAHLNENGIILMVVSSLTPEIKAIKIFEAQGFKAKILAEEKIPWEKLFAIRFEKQYL